jgi:hypothetical protein
MAARAPPDRSDSLSSGAREVGWSGHYEIALAHSSVSSTAQVQSGFRVRAHAHLGIAVKPICVAMGLDWSSQHKRLQRDPVLFKGMVIMTIPFGAGGPQDMVCMELEFIHGWLFRIDSTRVKDDAIRERVQDFQRECYRVLFNYFSGDRDKLVKEANDSESLSLRMVTEARHVWGDRAAAQLWERRGLPKVPAMDEAFRQMSLFDLAPHGSAANAA